MKLKPYPEYKDSGVPWLGKIPSHWEIRRAKYVFNVIDVRSKTGEEELLTVSANDGVVPRREKSVTMFMAKSYSGHKLCWPGDLVINSLWAWMQGLGFSRYHGIVSSAYGVYRPKVNYTTLWHYFNYLLRSKAYLWELRVRSKGVWLSRLQLLDDAFLDMPIIVPPENEAKLIVAFLDQMNQQIRRFLRAKRRMIELLNEQKQAIINQAVTRGLDPNVQLKPSGIDWFGEVPEHWKVASLDRIATKRCDGPFGSGLKSTHYTTEGIRVIRLQNIGHAEFRNKDAAYISREHYASLGDHDVIEGDLLIAGLGDDRIPAGRACVAPSGIEPAMVKADCFRFRLNRNKIIPQFAAYQLSATARVASAILSTGATRQRTNLRTTATRAIAFPTPNEQETIIARLSVVSLPLEAAISRANHEIDLIREYRERLITDVVTGKVDVRHLAASLPAVSEVREELAEVDTEEALTENEEPIEEEEIIDADD